MGGSGRDRGRESQPGKGRRSGCVVWAWCGCVWGGGAVLRVVRVVCVVGGQRQIESGKGSRAWMDIPHHLLVFSELVQHLRDQDHSHEM